MGRVGEGEGGGGGESWGRGGRRGEEGRKDGKVNPASSLGMESYTCTGDFPEMLRAKLELLLFIYRCLWAILSFGEID